MRNAKRKLNKMANKSEKPNKESLELELKLLKKYKKILLYKQKFFSIRQSGVIDKDFVDNFRTDMLPGVDEIYKDFTFPPLNKVSEDQIKGWFNKADIQSFGAETFQIINKLPYIEARNFADGIGSFERNFSGIKSEDALKMLFFQKRSKSLLYQRSLDKDKYASLYSNFKRNYPAAGFTTSFNALVAFKKFLRNDFTKICKEQSVDSTENTDIKIPDYALFVYENSNEFKRRILNVFFSVITDVEPSDEVPFVRRNGQCIDYTVFRILVWLRNHDFDYEKFKSFVTTIDANDLPNRMTIDYGITGSIKIFMKYVGDPQRVDDLIVTHRIVKGLWQNGSKFMNSYTLHNEDHAVKLIKLSVDIIKRIDYLQLKRIDFYILFMACYLHDLSMVIHPDLQVFRHVDFKNLNSMSAHISDLKELAEKFVNLKHDDEKYEKKVIDIWKDFGGFMLDVFNEVYSFFETMVRDGHPADSAQFVRKKSDGLFSYIDKSDISFITKVGENHGKRTSDIFDMVSNAASDTVSTKYISIVLRLADLLDVSNDRINYHLLNENVQHLPEKSKFHWISHLITDDIKLIPIYKCIEEKDSDNKIINHFIKETLRFYLILNVKSLTPINRDDCKKCIGWKPKAYREDKDCPPAYTGYEGITIEFQDDKCSEESCPMICWWMRNKHEWLYRELKTLEHYLNQTNHLPFKTKIQINILFKNLYNIEPHLYDSVYDYLKKL